LTVLLIEQNSQLTGAVADRVYIMAAGKIHYHDTPAQPAAQSGCAGNLPERVKDPANRLLEKP